MAPVRKAPAERKSLGVGRRSEQKFLFPLFYHMRVLIMAISKWAPRALDSKRLTLYRKLNTGKFDADYRGYTAFFEEPFYKKLVLEMPKF